MKLRTKILLGLIVVFAVLQIIPRNEPQNKEVSDEDIFAIESASMELKSLVEGACYDCHSYQTKHPWYSGVAPFSWWIDDHIEEAREHLNFSKWGSYTSDKRAHKAEEAVEEVDEGEMPLESYQLAHASARLSDDEFRMMINWFKSLETKYHKENS
jgi:hypothetical protein